MDDTERDVLLLAVNALRWLLRQDAGGWHPGLRSVLTAADTQFVAAVKLSEEKA